jgi:hypothetical protein
LSGSLKRLIVVDPTGGYSELDGTADPGRRAIE